jgi:hypothetical protein
MKYLWKVTYTIRADYGTGSPVITTHAAYLLTEQPSIPSIKNAIQSTLTSQYKCWEVTHAEYLGEILNPAANNQ